MEERPLANQMGTDPLVVSAEELRVNLAEYLSRVRYADTVVVVEKYNQETAFILSPRMLRRLISSGQATPSERANALKELDAIVSKVPDVDPKIYNKAINKAVAEVRVVKRRKSRLA